MLKNRAEAHFGISARVFCGEEGVGEAPWPRPTQEEVTWP